MINIQREPTEEEDIALAENGKTEQDIANATIRHMNDLFFFEVRKAKASKVDKVSLTELNTKLSKE